MVVNNVSTDCGFERQFLNDHMVKKEKLWNWYLAIEILNYFYQLYIYVYVFYVCNTL